MADATDVLRRSLTVAELDAYAADPDLVAADRRAPIEVCCDPTDSDAGCPDCETDTGHDPEGHAHA